MTVARWTFSADGDGTPTQVAHTKPLELEAVGTFGGGTVTLQQLGNDGSTWYDIDGVSLTANGVIGSIKAAGSSTLRAVLTGSTAPNLLVTLQEII